MLRVLEFLQVLRIRAPLLHTRLHFLLLRVQQVLPLLDRLLDGLHKPLHFLLLALRLVLFPRNYPKLLLYHRVLLRLPLQPLLDFLDSHRGLLLLLQLLIDYLAQTLQLVLEGVLGGLRNLCVVL